MRNKLLIGILSIVLFTCIAASALTAAYAWLTPGQPVAFDAKGNAIAGYFHSGTGTKDDPYILTRPKHLYNLAWLQYLGTFNVTDENGNLKQFFFELNNNIDMKDSAYRVLPPIGTTQYPFVGNFKGKGYSVSNAIVANIIDPGNNQISEFPPALLQEGSDRQNALQNVEIIGFFGVIGEYEEGSLGFTLTAEQLKYLGVENLLLENVVVQTSTDKSLAGLVAGFVNGNLTNVYVSSGTITARPDATTLRDDNVLSSYSLIGNYETTKINWIGGPMDGPTSTSGTNSGFGGSIDMLTLAKRITYMFDVGTTTESIRAVPIAEVRTNNHIYAHTFAIQATPFDYESTGQQVLTFRHGTYLALNINPASLKQENYTKTSTEDILSTNTGYIVGKYTTTSSSRALSLTSRLVGQLCNSMQGGSTSTGAWQSLKYTDEVDKKVQILTINTKGDIYVIGDNYNGLTSEDSPYEVYQNAGITVERYDSKTLNLTQYGDDTANQVRSKLSTYLKKQQIIFGVQFSTVSPNLTENEKYPDRAGVIKFDTPMPLGDKTVNSLVQDSVHFALEKAGVITMVLGTVSEDFNKIYGEGSKMRVQTLPKLYRVDREGNDIVNLEEITTIYRDDETGEISYNDTVTTGKTLVYDYSKMGRLCNSAASSTDVACMQSLFYFEIPASAGEYVFGSTQVSQAMTYLVYLDIGANAGNSSSSTPGTGTGTVANPTGKLTGVYFVDATGNPILQEDVTPDKDKTKPAVAFEIKLNTTNVSVSFEGTGTGVNVAITPTDGAEVKLVTATTEQAKMKKEEETTGP